MYEKVKYLVKNTGYLLIGNFSSKVLSFLMVPLYTYVLLPKEYGIYDVFYSTILMCIPFVSLNIVDAIMRFSLDQEEEIKKEVFSVAFKYTFLASIIFSFGFIFVTIFTRNETLIRYCYFVILLFIMILFNQNTIQVARGLDNVKSISMAGVIGTFLTVALNILFLIILKIGLKGYFLANIISLFIQNIYLIINNKMYRYVNFKYKIKSIEREMLLFSLPLIFNTLAWYINGVSDRYAITFMVGLAANGIYSISYKIPSIVNAIETIFIQSWQISAVKEINCEEGVSFYNTIYDFCIKFMIILCSITIMLTRILARCLFSSEFYVAWKYVPVLILYVYFNTLSGIIGGVFTAKKDSKTLAKTAIIGAVLNIVFNIILIYFIGIMGAALATAISSVVIWFLRYKASQKYIVYTYNRMKFIVCIGIILIQIVTMTYIDNLLCYAIQLMCAVALVVLFKREMKTCLKVMLNRH